MKCHVVSSEKTAARGKPASTRNAAAVAASVSTTPPPAAVEITARHDAEGRSDFINQTASVKVRMPF